MGLPAIGTIAFVNFPFADLKNYKPRPAVVVAYSSLDTVILCQITSRKLPQVPVIELTMNDFEKGSLPIKSYVRPDKLFTVDYSAVKNVLGQLKPSKVNQIRHRIRQLFS
ncbi:MAG TPA: type II toxin-antitoxin system PemK/MazF family toxin [Candidatus Saccharimonadales bacterium]|nr:type II toxin-antitoxin system PemK/MazF family toxin [Candidatus Saccharimonadales bacterium]